MKRLAAPATWWHCSAAHASRGQRRKAQPGGQPPRNTIGLDLHKCESQLCVLTADGELIERRIAMTRERFTAVLGGRPRGRVLLEASTESEWIARHLESLGHEVVAADSGFAPMYATRSRRVHIEHDPAGRRAVT